jgi:c-di-AMP phosphodiesterase-like protein
LTDKTIEEEDRESDFSKEQYVDDFSEGTKKRVILYHKNVTIENQWVNSLNPEENGVLGYTVDLDNYDVSQPNVGDQDINTDPK